MKTLTKKHIQELKEFDPVHDISEWAAYAANNNVLWGTNFFWNEHRAKRAIHPSSLGNICDMFLYLELVGAEVIKKSTSQQQMIFDVGTAIHEMMHYYQGSRAECMGYNYEKEVGFHHKEDISRRPDLKMAGHCDGRTLGWPLDTPVLWEYKSANDNSYQRLKSPMKDHLTQAHAYMANLEVPLMIIIYINKNASGEMAAFKIPFNSAFWKPHEDRIKRIVKMADSLTEPNKVVTKRCFKCQFYEECEPGIEPRRSEDLDESEF